jgi:ATP synthase protein I
MPFHPPIPDPKAHGKGSGVIDAIVQAEKMIQVALILPCAAFIGWLAGAWLGRRLHQPWIALVGIVFGGVSGLVYVVRLALQAGNESARLDSHASGDRNSSSHEKGSGQP